jgi:UDP-N-acetylglucosamine 2-epimerase
MMKIALHTFSPVVRRKSLILRSSLRKAGAEVLTWEKRAEADGCLIYNIHSLVYSAITEAAKVKKPLVSLQEGLFAIGWSGTHRGMRQECEKANRNGIKQLVWSRFERKNYIQMGRQPELVEHYGNPEYDLLTKEPDTTRSTYGVPEDAFLILHIDQYAHPRGGPNKNQISQMTGQIERLTNIDKKVWCIRSLHPINSSRKIKKTNGRVIVRPFRYPIFDFIRMADLVVTLSSTEGITSAILGKPIIQYDLSGSKERWPFTEHGVAVRATTYPKLVELTKLTMEKGLNLQPKIDYRREYHVDGKAADRVANNIVRYFNASN